MLIPFTTDELTVMILTLFPSPQHTSLAENQTKITLTVISLLVSMKYPIQMFSMSLSFMKNKTVLDPAEALMRSQASNNTKFGKYST